MVLRVFGSLIFHSLSTLRHNLFGGLRSIDALWSAMRALTVSKSSTITKEILNPTPGEVLLMEFIEPMGLTQNGLARAIGVPPRRINEVVLGKRSITADTDLRLARYFGVSEGIWLGLQADHDLLQRRRQIDADLARIAPYQRAA